MALIDASGRGVDDHEHFGGKIFAAAIENDARNMNVLGVVRMGPLKELERGQTMLPIDNQKVFLRLLEPPDAAAILHHVKTELLRREEQDRARNRRLRHGRFVEIA